jgi:hypothetical protein
MGRRKGELEIGYRASEEIHSRFPNMSDKEICQNMIGLDRKILWYWQNGLTPSGFALQRLCYAGCDIYYILTGRRDTRDKKGD